MRTFEACHFTELVRHIRIARSFEFSYMELRRMRETCEREKYLHCVRTCVSA